MEKRNSRSLFGASSLFIIICLVQINLFAQNQPDTIHTELDLSTPKNMISIDGLYLLLGTINVGYERVVFDKFSVYGNVGFGDLWFTDLKSMYEAGIKYNFFKLIENDIYAGISYSRISVSYKNESADVKSIGLILGIKFRMFDPFTIDGGGGIYMSNHPKHTFTEQDGGWTKSISVGGGNLGINIRIGISF